MEIDHARRFPVRHGQRPASAGLPRHVLLMLAAGLALATAAPSPDVTSKGSDTMTILAYKWAEVYMARHGGVNIQLSGKGVRATPDAPKTAKSRIRFNVTGGGSGTGFAALLNRTTDLANASRKIKTQEIEAFLRAFGKRPREYKVAMDGLCVYVNMENPLKELTLEQLGKIFTGKIVNWKEVGGPDAPIAIYSRDSSSGSYEFFKEKVLKGQDFAATAQTMPGTAALVEAVTHDKNGIGYGGRAYGKGVKLLALKPTAQSAGIEPTEANVLSHSYPIWRYLYIYLNPDLDKGDIAAYLTWIRSDEGQEVVREVGYFPLPPNLRK